MKWHLYGLTLCYCTCTHEYSRTRQRKDIELQRVSQMHR